MSTRFQHPDLGHIMGQSRGDVVQFRGIPYAHIPKRFRQSELTTRLPSQPFDARYPGPICPQPDLPYPQYWDGPLPVDYPDLPLPGMSEFDCLNLNITTPDLHSSAPVLVFFHGGALIGGSQSVQVAGREIYDPTSLVRASISRRQPLLVVTANYRVGPLGFLAGSALVEDNAGGPVGNYGFHDQRRVLEWCAMFIGGFGGDISNVTIQGSSAGGVSCHYHCLSPDALFRRAIIASGTFLCNGPMPLESHQEVFDAYAADLPTLRTLPAGELIKRAPDVRWEPLADGTWLTQDIMKAYRQRPGPRPDIMVGSSEYERETAIHSFTGLPTDMIPLRSRQMTRANKLPLDWAAFPDSSIASTYGLGSLTSWAQLVADVIFRLPPIYFAMHAPGRAFVFSIHATNPFPLWPLSYGHANHAINDIFVFDVAYDQVPDVHKSEYRAAVEDMQHKWIDFCYGRQPWGAFVSTGPIYVFRNGGSQEEASLRDAEGVEVERRWMALL
ncbi:Alpha/Beta hydrolase protein, partial [Coniochaeta sp. 2T2.1]